MLETSFIGFLQAELGLSSGSVFYQHLTQQPPATFVWFVRNGDERADSLDDDGEEPFVVFFDVEIYAGTPAAIQQKSQQLRSISDHRGAFGGGFVQDVSVQDQRDDYENQANAESLPAYSAAFRVSITGYTA